MGSAFRVAPDVARAVAEGRPVVCLETAVLTHGLPRPDNREVCAGMVEAVRAAGAVPAPVAVVAGTVTVGVDPADLDRLAAGGPDVRKVSVHNLPAVVAAGEYGGTTVAATLWAAARAGVAVFATGGLGGVHRGGGGSLDLSGDLVALARYGGCVVCSGPKAVLDVAATVQVLETAGVVVAGYGTGRLPAFVAHPTDLAAGTRIDTPAEAAGLVRARDALGLSGAVVVANPPPPEHALPWDQVDRAVTDAHVAAEAAGVVGPELTPFLLREVARLTAGRSVASNRALLVGNAGLAARIACCLAFPGGPRLP